MERISPSFLGIHIAQQLLQRGFHIRCPVRSVDKGNYLRRFFLKQGFGSNVFEYVIVEDMQKEGVFDLFLNDVDAIVHTASPVHMNKVDPWKGVINPAVQGTLNILRSAAKNPRIKRVVYTSSIAAVVSNTKVSPYTYTERDWNDEAVQKVEEGKDVDPTTAYRASKTLAERTAWKFFLNEKTTFDLVTICPPLIFGPLLHDVPSPSSLNVSINFFYQYLLGNKTNDDAIQPAFGWVDVRDVARCHVKALLREKAGGKRFLVSTDSFTYQLLLDVLSLPHNLPLLRFFPNATKGHPGTPKPLSKLDIFESTPAKELLGYEEPIGLERCARDMMRCLIRIHMGVTKLKGKL
ncbi:BQ2448_7174 [Microbotryum intermedium]|uniref:BQ2448_7174 protein n=1 Tax=Microbotryum intermedium TaxID=269621 RepID=A0A238FKC8_9BASI|nr:BQ2448_7174 [Microbotryum intermedium]